MLLLLLLLLLVKMISKIIKMRVIVDQNVLYKAKPSAENSGLFTNTRLFGIKRHYQLYKWPEERISNTAIAIIILLIVIAGL